MFRLLPEVLRLVGDAETDVVSLGEDSSLGVSSRTVSSGGSVKLPAGTAVTWMLSAGAAELAGAELLAAALVAAGALGATVALGLGVGALVVAGGGAGADEVGFGGGGFGVAVLLGLGAGAVVGAGVVAGAEVLAGALVLGGGGAVSVGGGSVELGAGGGVDSAGLVGFACPYAGEPARTTADVTAAAQHQRASIRRTEPPNSDGD